MVFTLYLGVNIKIPEFTKAVYQCEWVWLWSWIVINFLTQMIAICFCSAVINNPRLLLNMRFNVRMSKIYQGFFILYLVVLSSVLIIDLIGLVVGKIKKYPEQDEINSGEAVLNVITRVCQVFVGLFACLFIYFFWKISKDQRKKRS